MKGARKGRRDAKAEIEGAKEKLCQNDDKGEGGLLKNLNNKTEVE